MQKPNGMLATLSCLLLWLGLVLGCASAPPTALPAPTPEQQRIQRLLVDIHMNDFLERVQTVSLRVAGKPRDRQLPEDQRLRPRIEAQLAPDAVLADVVRRVAEAFEPEFVAEIERFDASEVGRKLREAAGVPYSWFSRLGYRMFGSSAGGPPERVALIAKLDALVLSGQTTTDLYIRIYEAIVRWYEAKGFIDTAEADAVGGIAELVARERKQVEEITGRHTLPFGLYALSDLSTAELAEYVAQAGSPAGQWYAKAVREALLDSIDARAEAIER